MANEMTQPLSGRQVFNAVGGAALLLLAGWYVYSQSSPTSAAATHIEREINSKVSSDAVKSYGIAKRQGDAMQTCIQAGLVSAAFLQAHDEASYRKWKATEASDCRAAGLSSP